jgi:hypothetical protein
VTAILVLGCQQRERPAKKGMERLWGPAGATSRNRWQMGRALKPRKHDGKEGVGGSSPSEGFPKVPANGTLSLSARKTRGHISDTFWYARRTATLRDAY